MNRARPAGSPVFVLSEGPSWDPGSQELTWVDIEAGLVLAAPLQTVPGTIARLGPISTVELGARVGFAVRTHAGGLLVGLDRTLALIDAPSGRVDRSRLLVAEGRRFNDAKVDPQGRLVAGTLTLAGDGEGNTLIRLESDGSITTLDDDLGLSNGLGWSPDGTWFYSIDTDSRTVHRRRYGPDGVGRREVHIELDGPGWPDGMSVDSEGNLWVAGWGGGGVRVFAADGTPRPELDVSIEAPHCSSIAFAGETLDTLVITSASRDLDDADRARWPDAGGLFIARAPIRGLPVTPWSPVTLGP